MDFIQLRNQLQLPYNRSTWQEILRFAFGAQVSIDTKAENIIVEKGKAKSIQRFAAITLQNNINIAVIEIETKKEIQIARNRVALRDIVFKLIDQDRYHGLLVLYFSEDVVQKDYRLSFISSQTEFDADGNLIKSQTNPKRFSYVLGTNESCTTATQRFLHLKLKTSKCEPFVDNKIISLKDLLDAFSVEALNKEFFKKYKEIHYKKFWEYIGNTPNYAKLLLDKDSVEVIQQQKPIRDFVKKLLGRIVFLHFLQKKGWMGCSPDTYNWENGDKQFMQNLFANYKDKEHFYSTCLIELFHNTLNNADRKNGLFKHTKTRVPYLNGGLFDDDQPQTNGFDFPIDYFKDLLDFFSQYNFTIDENSPEEQEVGIDPEMLGHIFENLLEDNKDKGTFYTPRQIVHYMCQESLIEYLRTHLPNHDAEAINEFIRGGDIGDKRDKKNYIVNNAKRIEELLDKVKICDPAIGSGAFPMGMLQEIFKAKLALDLTLDRALAKKEIIQNSIYGVDLEKGAVDIARLRFWLALVVDEDEPQPLPNLDYKIMQGNSLLESFGGVDLSKLIGDDAPDDMVIASKGQMELQGFGKNQSAFVFDKITKEEIQGLIKLYFDFDIAKNKQYKTKQAVKQAINKVVDGKLSAKFALDKIALHDKLVEKQKHVKANAISVKDPKGIALRKEKALQKLNKEIETLEYKINHFEDVLHKLTQWEHEDNNRTYFLWHTYFKDVFDEGGFDIVIGNPPYLRIQGIRDNNSAFADELLEEYDSATGSFDLYVVFLEKGLSIIKGNGIVNYIMPVKWTNAAFGSGLRDVVSKKKAAHKIINFGAHQVFNASTYTGLQWFKNDTDNLIYHELNHDLGSKEDIGNYLNSLNNSLGTLISHKKLAADSWILTEGKIAQIINKLNSHPRRLSDVFDKIFQGLATSKDDVYFLYNCEFEGDYVIGFSKHLNTSVKVESGFVKPLLKGEDVHRYQPIETNRVVIFPYRLINDNAELYKEEDIKNEFPFAYRYLKQCEGVLRDREKGRLKEDSFWYRYIYPKNLTLFKNEKLVAPEISQGGNFSYDENGGFYSTTTIYGYVKKIEVVESYKCLIAILNSQLFWWYLVNTGTVLANGYFRYKPNYIKPFPLPLSIPKETSDLLEKMVDDILVKKRINTKGDCNKIEEKINLLVYQLYQLSEEDINLINSV